MGEEGDHLNPLQLSIENRLTMCIHTMHLENLFCRIDANSPNFHDGCFVHSDDSSSHFDTSDASLRGKGHYIDNAHLNTLYGIF